VDNQTLENDPSPIMTKLAQYSAQLYARLPEDNPAYTKVASIEVA